MKILYAEDEPALSRAVTMILTRNHYIVDTVCDGQQAIERLNSGCYDAVILDVMMPKLDGLSVLKEIRKRGNLLPVLLLTARADISDRVEGLDAGANDYLPKPFDTQELLARIRAMTRSQDSQYSSNLHVGNVTLNRNIHELSTQQGSFRLANKEFQMMELLMCNPGCTISSEHFIEKIWSHEKSIERNAVWVYISYLRKKLAAIHADVQIQSARSTGYSLVLMTE